MLLLENIIKNCDITVKYCCLATHNKHWAEHSCKTDHDLWIVQSGEIKIICDGHTDILHKGDIYFFPQNKIYQATSNTEECSFLYLHFVFKLNTNNRVLENFLTSGVIRHKEVKQEYNMFMYGYNLYKNKLEYSFLSLKGFFIILLTAIFRIKCSLHINDIKNKSPFIKFENTFKYIAQNITGDLSIPTLAKISGMSEKHFHKSFKNTTGITPAKYIENIKLNMAVELLYEKKYSIKEIADKLGYNDQYVFSKTFKRKYLVSPANFIKNK